MNSNNEANIKINLNAFEYNAIDLKEIKLNDQNESIFRLSSAKLISKPSCSSTVLKEPSSISSIKCSACHAEILKENDCFNYLKLPENDLDELADNFFCHLHDHNHNKCHEEDLTNILNPMRDNKHLRKSILENLTLIILNSNHIKLESVKEDSFDLKCSQCLSNLGYRKKNSFDFFIWKSSVMLNNDFVLNASYFTSQLVQGKYLIECKNESNLLLIWILNDKALFNHFKLTEMNSEIKLNLNFVKKCLFKLLIKEKDETEIKKLKNDCNVNYILVSKELLKNVLNFMNESNSKLCRSLQKSNNFFFSII